MEQYHEHRYGNKENYIGTEEKDPDVIYFTKEIISSELDPSVSKQAGAIYKGDEIMSSTTASGIIFDKDIVVSGLDNDFGCGLYKNGDAIPAGTNILSVLENMLSKNLYPGVATKSRLTQSIYLRNGGANVGNSTFELGTELTLYTHVLNTIRGSFNHTDPVAGTEYESPESPDNTWGTYEFGSLGLVGFTGTISSGTTVDRTKTFNDTLVVANTTCYVTSTTSSALYENVTLPKTNKGLDYTPDLYSAGGSGSLALVDSSVCVAPTMQSATITGRRKYFIGSLDYKFTDTEWTSGLTRGLNLASGFITGNNTANIPVVFPIGAKQQIVAIPTSAMIVSARDGAGSDILGTYTDNGLHATVMVEGANGFVPVEYTIYVAPANAGLVAPSAATFVLK